MRTKQYSRSTPSPAPLLDAPYIPTTPGSNYLAIPYTSTIEPMVPTLWPSTPAMAQNTLPAFPSYPPPSSPPPLDHSRSPYATIALPSQLPNEEGEAIVHPLLERAPALFPMHWDVRTSPLEGIANAQSAFLHRQQSQGRRDHGSSSQWQYQAATLPALDSIVIRTAALGGEPLVVFPRGSLHHFVTVLDVLDAVHRAIGFEHVDQDVERASSEKGRRSARASLDLTRIGAERAGRGDRTRFGRGWLWGGLTPSPTERDVWILLLH